MTDPTCTDSDLARALDYARRLTASGGEMVAERRGERMSDDLFYIMSLKWTKQEDRLITWWGPKNSGYYFRIKLAGTYTREQIEADPNRYNDGTRTLAIPVSAVEPLLVPVSSVKSRELDGDRDVDDLLVEYRHFTRLKKKYARRGQPSPPERP